MELTLFGMFCEPMCDLYENCNSFTIFSILECMESLINVKREILGSKKLSLEVVVIKIFDGSQKFELLIRTHLRMLRRRCCKNKKLYLMMMINFHKLIKDYFIKVYVLPNTEYIRSEMMTALDVLISAMEIVCCGIIVGDLSNGTNGYQKRLHMFLPESDSRRDSSDTNNCPNCCHNTQSFGFGCNPDFLLTCLQSDFFESFLFLLCNPPTIWYVYTV